MFRYSGRWDIEVAPKVAKSEESHKGGKTLRHPLKFFGKFTGRRGDGEQNIKKISLSPASLFNSPLETGTK